MNAEQHDLGADLAFLRALAEGGGESQRGTGAALLVGGLLYGLQCFVAGAHAYGWVQQSERFQSLFATGITVAFLLALAWIMWSTRKASEGGVAARALQAAFAGSGTATIAMLCVFATVALREESLTIWLLYPCAVFALQGAAWMVAWRLRRRIWLGVVALGWMVSSVALSSAIGSPLYPMVAGVALVLFMAVPGAVMMRPAKN
ncbi:MAG TPA: hypothetical protein VL379_04120 [Pseudomonadales bacterium]|jgi:hypothetical protein|nr:hypothetical protein [Pseudomonadales bacterium]